MVFRPPARRDGGTKTVATMQSMLGSSLLNAAAGLLSLEPEETPADAAPADAPPAEAAAA